MRLNPPALTHTTSSHCVHQVPEGCLRLRQDHLHRGEPTGVYQQGLVRFSIIATCCCAEHWVGCAASTHHTTGLESQSQQMCHFSQKHASAWCCSHCCCWGLQGFSNFCKVGSGSCNGDWNVRFRTDIEGNGEQLPTACSADPCCYLQEHC